MYKTYECAQKCTKPALFSYFRNAQSLVRVVLTTAIHPLHETRTRTRRRSRWELLRGGEWLLCAGTAAAGAGAGRGGGSAPGGEAS